MEDIELWFGDSYNLLNNIPSEYVDLTIIDPPYFKVKKHYWDNQWKNENIFLEWFDSILSEIFRVGKLSSSLYVFSYPRIANKIENLVANRFNVLNQIVWEKENDKGFDGWKQKTSIESLRRFYPNSERIVFAEKQSFGKILKQKRLESGISTIELARMIGAHGAINHGGSVSNWESDLNIPTDAQYNKLSKILSLPKRDDVIRKMYLNRSIQYQDVFHFKTVRPYKGKHPCEKPEELISHLIKVSSDPNDIVLDCFMGTGSTGISAKKLNRKFIGIDADKEYYRVARERIDE